jgi:hypothetical protein
VRTESFFFDHGSFILADSADYIVDRRRSSWVGKLSHSSFESGLFLQDLSEQPQSWQVYARNDVYDVFEWRSCVSRINCDCKFTRFYCSDKAYTSCNRICNEKQLSVSFYLQSHGEIRETSHVWEVPVPSMNYSALLSPQHDWGTFLEGSKIVEEVQCEDDSEVYLG